VPSTPVSSLTQQPTTPSEAVSDTNSAFHPSSAFSSAISATYSSFWDNTKQMFSINDLSCKPFDAPAVWPIAVMGKAAVFSGNPNYIGQSLSNLYQYYNSAGWFSASTNKDNDVYVDDNAQVAWVYLDAYKLTKNQAHLNQGQSLVNLIQTQWSTVGGVLWQLNGEYVASISTTEAALAAVKLYEYTNDPSLLQFANNCLDFIDNMLTDPSDGLIYDGYQINNGQTNKGKLTYTVGVMMSTLAYLNKFTGDPTYIDRAIKLADAATNKQGAFYNKFGYWNNSLKYVHLLFVGFSDLITLTSGDYSKYIAEVQKQGQYIYQYLQAGDTGNYFDSVYSYTPAMYQKYTKFFTPSQSFSPSPSNFCNGNLNGTPLYSFMNDASAAQIMYSVSKL
jgi:rhamnogalacturonyl hydrolase YesR